MYSCSLNSRKGVADGVGPPGHRKPRTCRGHGLRELRHQDRNSAGAPARPVHRVGQLRRAAPHPSDERSCDTGRRAGDHPQARLPAHLDSPSPRGGQSGERTGGSGVVDQPQGAADRRRRPSAGRGLPDFPVHSRSFERSIYRCGACQRRAVRPTRLRRRETVRPSPSRR